MKILNNIKSPDDIVLCDDLYGLACELKEEILKVVSENGGHLSSNLGVIELTIALLHVFGNKENDIVWDVGHQCYAYKMLTGRFQSFNSLRKSGGISGFSCKSESCYDKFTTGHSSTAVSAGLGIARAKRLLGSKGKAIAILGDGAMTGGLAFEGFNNTVKQDKNFIVILNDNNMSISANVGAVASYLTRLRIRPNYLNIKQKISKILCQSFSYGEKIKVFFSNLKSLIKNILFREGTVFENLGFGYYGPIDGHDILELIKIFNSVKTMEKPVVIHVITKKGHGYSFAKKTPDSFHAISGFNLKTGRIQEKSRSFSKVFGETILKIAENNKKIFAVTAAMSESLCLKEFAEKFPERFADVGIAESHAAVFSSGMAAGGMIPIFAVYSTFLQRVFDQLIHDVSMQRLKVIFAVDRAGLVGEDGESHQGIFDVPFLGIIPRLQVYSPSFFVELEHALELSVNSDSASVVRYPKGEEFFKPEWLNADFNDFDLYGTGGENLIITYGRIFSFAAQIIDKFPGKISVLKLNKILPVPIESVKLACNFKNIFFFEESIKSGGIGEKFLFNLIALGFKGRFSMTAIEEFVKHGKISEQLSNLSLDFSGMVEKLGNL
jgi:1-deoxy-D-xylulose-5-phosphate synthase